MTISAFSDELAQVRTKKKEFLSQIERIVPWKEWLSLIRPCYYKGERGNKPYPLEIMLRLYLLQNLYDLSDEATAAEAIDSRAFSDFCGIDSSNQGPDGDTLGRFRNLLIKNGLQEKLFAQVVAALMERGLILKKGTIVDSTIISAPSSTKNKEKKRDPDAFTELMQLHEKDMYRTANAILPQDADIADAMQETILTEEEWLEIIEYVHKLDYSMQEKIWQKKAAYYRLDDQGQTVESTEEEYIKEWDIYSKVASPIEFTVQK